MFNAQQLGMCTGFVSVGVLCLLCLHLAAREQMAALVSAREEFPFVLLQSGSSGTKAVSSGLCTGFGPCPFSHSWGFVVI